MGRAGPHPASKAASVDGSSCRAARAPVAAKPCVCVVWPLPRPCRFHMASLRHQPSSDILATITRSTCSTARADTSHDSAGCFTCFTCRGDVACAGPRCRLCSSSDHGICASGWAAGGEQRDQRHHKKAAWTLSTFVVLLTDSLEAARMASTSRLTRHDYGMVLACALEGGQAEPANSSRFEPNDGAAGRTSGCKATTKGGGRRAGSKWSRTH